MIRLKLGSFAAISQNHTISGNMECPQDWILFLVLLTSQYLLIKVDYSKLEKEEMEKNMA